MIVPPVVLSGPDAPPTRVFKRPTSLGDDLDAHAAGGTLDLLDGAVEIDRVEIPHLDFGDLPYLISGNSTDRCWCSACRIPFRLPPLGAADRPPAVSW